MSDRLAFLGDVHGNITALESLLEELACREVAHVVGLGDYINKGPNPAQVMRLLLAWQQAGDATLLAGNHETALLAALDTGDLTAFLKMGGATTIRSYVGRPVEADVLRDFRAHLPEEHVLALRAMPTRWEDDDVIAQHTPPAAPYVKFTVTAHIPTGTHPRIGDRAAEIDTGSGSDSSAGRLTALLWPSRAVVQADTSGAILTN